MSLIWVKVMMNIAKCLYCEKRFRFPLHLNMLLIKAICPNSQMNITTLMQIYNLGRSV